MSNNVKKWAKFLGLWFLGIICFIIVGGFIEVVLGLGTAGYGGITGALWAIILGRRYEVI